MRKALHPALTLFVATLLILLGGQWLLTAAPGCGFKGKDTNCGVTADFCNTPANTCAKTTYTPCKGTCQSSTDQYDGCDTWFSFNIKVKYYPGSCGAGGCTYGAAQNQPDQWGDVNSTYRCQFWSQG